MAITAAWSGLGTMATASAFHMRSSTPRRRVLSASALDRRPCARNRQQLAIDRLAWTEWSSPPRPGAVPRSGRATISPFPNFLCSSFSRCSTSGHLSFYGGFGNEAWAGAQASLSRQRPESEEAGDPTHMVIRKPCHKPISRRTPGQRCFTCDHRRIRRNGRDEVGNQGDAEGAERPDAEMGPVARMPIRNGCLDFC